MSSLQKFHRRTNGGTSPFVAAPPVDKSLLANTLNIAGTVLTSATQKKYGAASTYIAPFNGVYTDKSTNFKLGSADFTMETWVYVVEIPSATYPAFISFGGGGTRAITSFIGHASWPNKITIEGNCGGTGFLANGAIDIPIGVWTHIAYVRQANSLKIYVNGVLDFTIVISGSFDEAGNPGFFTNARVSASSGDLQRLTIYIDDFRVTKNVARYTSNFTVPLSAFPENSSDPYWSNVVLLINGE